MRINEFTDPFTLVTEEQQITFEISLVIQRWNDRNVEPMVITNAVYKALEIYHS